MTTNLTRNLWLCLADDAELSSALLNLVLNARSTLPHGKGEIRISTENCPAALWRRPGVPAADYVRVTVADNGTGMPADVLRRAAEVPRAATEVSVS